MDKRKPPKLAQEIGPFSHLNELEKEMYMFWTAGWQYLQANRESNLFRGKEVPLCLYLEQRQQTIYASISLQFACALTFTHVSRRSIQATQRLPPPTSWNHRWYPNRSLQVGIPSRVNLMRNFQVSLTIHKHTYLYIMKTIYNMKHKKKDDLVLHLPNKRR